MKINDFIVIQDTREQQPWDFSYFPGFAGVEKRKLDSGDYTIFGHEKTIAIERKKSTSEIATNFGTKLQQFENEMQRMQPITHKYIICEFPLENVYSFPINSGIPTKRHKFLKISGQYLAIKISQFSNLYGVTFIFSGNKFNAEAEVYSLFQKVLNV